MVFSDLLVLLGEYAMLLIYVLPIAIAVLWTHSRKRRKYEEHKQLLEENVKAGLTEPASLQICALVVIPALKSALKAM